MNLRTILTSIVSIAVLVTLAFLFTTGFLLILGIFFLTRLYRKFSISSQDKRKDNDAKETSSFTDLNNPNIDKKVVDIDKDKYKVD
jgi:predicted ABC-type exoprotein transport system permease subunit